jgi:hypothetical protein
MTCEELFWQRKPSLEPAEIETGTVIFYIEALSGSKWFDIKQTPIIDICRYVASHCRSDILEIKAHNTFRTNLGWLQGTRAIQDFTRILFGQREPDEGTDHIEYLEEQEIFEIYDDMYPDHIWDRTWEI